MSGHSHAANVKRTKAKVDNARAKNFTKLGRELAVAVKAGGSDPKTNSRLADAITKAKYNNMPNDTIDRGIKKAAGELGSINFENIIYEGYGIGGSAVVVETLTDNRTRTASDVRHYFDKYGGSMGLPNSVMFMFEKKGIITTAKNNMDEDELFENITNAGAEDFEVLDDELLIVTKQENLLTVKSNLNNMGFIITSAEIVYEPVTTVDLSDEQKSKFLVMLDKLEENDDVQEVYHNVNI